METKITFGQAIEALKQNKKVKREMWDNKYIVLLQGYPVNGHLNSSNPHVILPEDSPEPQGLAGQMFEQIILKLPGKSKYWGQGFSDYEIWAPSHTDILSKDWLII